MLIPEVLVVGKTLGQDICLLLYVLWPVNDHEVPTAVHVVVLADQEQVSLFSTRTHDS